MTGNLSLISSQIGLESISLHCEAEANFAKDEKLKIAYTDFIKEYIDQGHMTLSSNFDSLSNNSQAFLPHHGVWKETSTTTKLRTVFNSSSKTKSVVSVNELLHIGPNLLQNPVALICAWRRYKIRPFS